MILSGVSNDAEVRATGRKSLPSLGHGSLGTGMMCEVFPVCGDSVCVECMLENGLPHRG